MTTVTTPAATSSESFVAGNLRITFRDVALDSSYPTGGEAITMADLGLQVLYDAIASIKTAGTGSVTSVYFDVANMKLKAYTATAEVANATDLSAIAVKIIAFGK